MWPKKLKIAYDTKLFSKVGSDINCAKLRADLRKLYNWSEDWKMLFNLDKCKIMHFGNNNPNNIFSTSRSYFRNC